MLQFTQKCAARSAAHFAEVVRTANQQASRRHYATRSSAHVANTPRRTASPGPPTGGPAEPGAASWPLDPSEIFSHGLNFHGTFPNCFAEPGAAPWLLAPIEIFSHG